MNCTNCQTQLNPGSSFCANCGTPAQPVVTPSAPHAPRAASPTNGLAIASLVTSVATVLFCGGLLSFVGAILGHVALNQIKKNGQAGRGLAIGGIATGWAITGIWLLLVTLAFSLSNTSTF